MARAKKLPSGSWRVLVYSHTEIVDGKKVRRYESFTADDKKQAQLMAAEYAATKERLKLVDITLEQAYAGYLEIKKNVLSPSTYREYKRMSQKNLQVLMPVKIRDITQSMVQSAINDEAATASPKTVRNLHGLLSAVLDMYRPALKLTTTMPQKKPYNSYIPSDDDIKKLIASIRDTELEVPVLLAAFGSLRRGEVCALDYTDIQDDTISVSKALVLDADGEWVTKGPKSEAGYRKVLFPHEVIERIPPGEGRIVRLTPNQVSDRFADALKRNDIPHFRFHDLRHYQASILHALGVPEAYILERGGWRSSVTLKTVYRHAMEAKSKEVAEVANQHFSSIMQHEMQHKKENMA